LPWPPLHRADATAPRGLGTDAGGHHTPAGATAPRCAARANPRAARKCCVRTAATAPRGGSARTLAATTHREGTTAPRGCSAEPLWPPLRSVEAPRPEVALGKARSAGF